jgi:hypothetical protein
LQRSIDRYNITAQQKADKAAAGGINTAGMTQQQIDDLVTGLAKDAQAQATQETKDKQDTTVGGTAVDLLNQGAATSLNLGAQTQLQRAQAAEAAAGSPA